LWKVSEDGWRTLADEEPTPRPLRPKRPSSIISSAPPPEPVPLEKLRTRTRTLTPPPMPTEDTPLPPPIPAARRGWRLQTPPQPIATVDNATQPELQSWNQTERRLWRVAGSLIIAAIIVVGVLGVVTFWPALMQPAAVALKPIDAAPSSSPLASAGAATYKPEPARAIVKPTPRPPARRHVAKAKHAHKR
jgi:hypothetical protein